MPSKISWTLKLSDQASKDLACFRKTNKKNYQKCFDLTLAVIADPHAEIGKPEHLKYLGGNVWSRRITLEHRMVYEIFNDLIVVIAYRYHYS